METGINSCDNHDNFWGRLAHNIVIQIEYSVELKAYKAAFDATTRRMMKISHCNISSQRSCDTGEYAIIFKADQFECGLTLLINVSFLVITEKRICKHE